MPFIRGFKPKNTKKVIAFGQPWLRALCWALSSLANNWPYERGRAGPVIETFTRFATHHLPTKLAPEFTNIVSRMGIADAPPDKDIHATVLGIKCPRIVWRAKGKQAHAYMCSGLALTVVMQ